MRAGMVTMICFGFVLVSHGTAAGQNLLINGSFETGDFTGWGVKDIAIPFIPVAVRGSGFMPGFGLFDSSPTDGVFAATHGFDGGGPDTIEIFQDVFLPSASLATLTFDWRAGWNFFVDPTTVRMLDVVIEPSGGGPPLSVTNILTADGNVNPFIPDTGPQTAVLDLSAFVGSTIRINLKSTIPTPFTGPAHLQIDHVFLGDCSEVVLSAADATGPAVAQSGEGLLGVFTGFRPSDGDIVSFDDPSLTEPPIGLWAAIVNQVNFPDLSPDPLDVFVTTGTTGAPGLGVNDVSLGDLIGGDSFLPAPSTFTAKFVGCINIREPGCYRFVVGHDDGARLSIGNQTILDFNALTDFRVTTGTVKFADAGLYPICLEMFENFGEADLVLSFIPPGADEPIVVPESMLFPCDVGPTSVEVSKDAFVDGSTVFGTITITNVGENLAIISAIEDTLEVHFPGRVTPPPLPAGSTPNWHKVADVPVRLPGIIPVGEEVILPYRFSICCAADSTGANSMRNAVTVTVANKRGRSNAVTSRSDSFPPPVCDCLREGILYGTDAAGGSLLTVDAFTGAGNVVGPMVGGRSFAFPSLALDPTTGILYAGGGGGAPFLHVVNPNTGAVSFVGESHLGVAAIGGMDFRADGSLFAAVNLAGAGGTGSDHLARIDKFTGAAFIIGPFGQCKGTTVPATGAGDCTIEGIEAIGFDASGTLWGARSARGAAGDPGLYRIDTLTGAATFVAKILDASGSDPSGGVVSLQFACDGTLFGGTARGLGGFPDGGRLITIDPATGVFAFVGPIPATSGSSLGGLAFQGAQCDFAPPPPLPPPPLPDHVCCLFPGAFESFCVPAGECGELDGTVLAGCDPDDDKFSLCLPPPPPPEACCFPFDGFCADLQPGLCVDFGGVPQGPGSDCATTECPIEACCFPGGFCEHVDPVFCVEDGGEPLGPGSDCANTVCPGAEACCFSDGFCENLLPGFCQDVVGGEPLGPGSDCATTECPTEACCFPFDEVCKDLLPGLCRNSGGEPQGPGSDCASTECPIEACCLPFGCDELEPGFCAEIGGEPQGPGSDCATDLCEPLFSACCFEDGNCAELTFDECLAERGLPHPPGVPCAPDLCRPQLSACCFEDGNCAELTFDECLAERGLPHPPGVPCAPDLCRRACCFEDGNCAELTFDECLAERGLPHPVGVFCEPDLCRPPPPETVCCVFPGTDVSRCVTADECLLEGGARVGICDPAILGFECRIVCCVFPDEDISICGTFDACLAGDGEPGDLCDLPLAGLPCEEPPPPTSACCFGDVCAELTFDECVAGGGLPHPVGVFCDPDLCRPELSACCFEDGSCEELPFDECEDRGGLPHPVGVLCEPDLCIPELGACCFGDGTCAELTFDECLTGGGFPNPEGVLCEPGLCLNACCFVDGSCADLSLDDCLVNGGEPAPPGSLSCNEIICAQPPPPPVCCAFPDTVVFRCVTEDECLEKDGEPLGICTPECLD